MGAKVTFNEITKIIEITQAPDANDEIFIDVKEDLYSDGKEDWVANENLRKFYFPVEAVGGNPLPGEKALGTTFFLASDWKIRPYNASHRLIINGNLYSEDGSDFFLDTVGTYTVRIMQQVSSLVDSTIQQLPEIEYASFNGGVTVDTTSSYSGTSYPIGTPQAPVNNLIDALAIAIDRGFTSFFILGDITIDDSLSFNGMAFIGESQVKSTLTVEANADVEDCHFYDAHVTGVLDGGCKIQGCMITDLNYINGIIEQCLLEPGTIILGGSQEAHLVDCWSGAVGGSIPYIDMGSTGQDLIIRNYNGDLGIKNLSGMDGISIDLNSGSVTLDNTITNGSIIIRGVGNVVDNSNGASVDIRELVNPDNISLHVWNSLLADHPIAGTFGHELATKADLAAAASTDYSTAISGSVIEGSEDSGTFASVQIRDNVYWQIGEDGTNGLIVELTFNIPNGNKPGQVVVFGRYVGVPSTTHFLDCIAYNYEAAAWETLVSEFMPGGMTSDAQYAHEYFERNIDRSNNNEVKIRLAHNVTTYNASHVAYLDLVNVSSIEVITASDISDAVWQHNTSLKLLGLVQENYVMDQQVYQDYNGAKLLTSARIRTYQDAAKTQLIATYQVTATWSNGACTSYEMVIV